MSEHTEAVKSNLGDAGAHLKQAASAAGGAIKSAAGAAGDELRVGKAQVKSELADGAVAGLGAAEHLGGAAGEQVNALMDKGRDLLDSAAELILSLIHIFSARATTRYSGDTSQEHYHWPGPSQRQNF